MSISVGQIPRSRIARCKGIPICNLSIDYPPQSCTDFQSHQQCVDVWKWLFSSLSSIQWVVRFFLTFVNLWVRNVSSIEFKFSFLLQGSEDLLYMCLFKNHCTSSLQTFILLPVFLSDCQSSHLFVVRIRKMSSISYFFFFYHFFVCLLTLKRLIFRNKTLRTREVKFLG